MTATLTLSCTRFGIGIGPWIDNRAGEWHCPGLSQVPTTRATGHGDGPRERGTPHVRDVGGRGDVEVDPAADDAGRHHPQRDVADQVRVAAEGARAAADQDRQRDPDDVAEGVEADVQRADVEAADRRTGNVLRQRAGAMRRRLPHRALMRGPWQVRSRRLATIGMLGLILPAVIRSWILRGPRRSPRSPPRLRRPGPLDASGSAKFLRIDPVQDGVAQPGRCGHARSAL